MKVLYICVVFLVSLFSETLNSQVTIDCNSIETSCSTEIYNYSLHFLLSNCSDKWNGPCTTVDPIFRSGRVGIGTQFVPFGYRLAVSGEILTEELRICTNIPWCDFVFDENYQLMSLSEMERYIKKNRKLPGFPSEKKIIAQAGFKVEEITISQQEKIEEIYLHLFDINKKINNVLNSYYEK